MRAAVSLLTFLCALSYSQAETPESIRVVSDSWPPYVTRDAEMPGVDVEAMLAVFEQLDIAVHFELVPWRRAQNETQSGQADALLDVGINDERIEQYWFTEEPINESVTTLFCQACDTSQPITTELFQDQTLVVNRGYQYKGSFDEDPNIKRIEAGSFRQGFQLLAAGRADYFIVNRDVGYFTAKQLNLTGIQAMQDNVSEPSPIYLAFHRSRNLKSLADDFSKQLALFKKTEEYREILAKYGIQR